MYNHFKIWRFVLKINAKNDIFVVGDVHGCFETLKALVKKLPNDSTVVFTGDLIDRGPKSKEVVQYIIDNGFYSVQGNHEREFCFLDAENNGTPVIRDYMYGDWGIVETMKSYLKNFDKKIYRRHIDFLSNLPLFIEIEDLVVSHSLIHHIWKGSDEGLYTEKDIDRLLYSHLINRSGNIKYSGTVFNNGFFNIFGHTYFPEVFFTKEYACVDTGVVFGGKLTALSFPDFKIVEQPYVD